MGIKYYISIPVLIHRVHSKFFGFNAPDREERNASEGFKLHVLDGRVINAILTQDNGKSLQKNPQSILGRWILHDVLGLKERELITMQRLIELGVDSLKVTKIDNHNYKIELAEMYAFEKWKIDNKNKI